MVIKMDGDDPLTQEKVGITIDRVISSATDQPPMQVLTQSGLSLRRAKDDNAWKRILECDDLSRNSNNISQLMSAMTPWFFGVEILDNNSSNGGKTCGFVTFYVAFSSWNGKILHLDRMQCSVMNDTIEETIFRVLAQMAVELDFARLTWMHILDPNWHREGSNPPETHEEYLTLCMNRDSIDSYVQNSFSDIANEALLHGSFTGEMVSNSIDAVLEEIDKSNKVGKFALRLAKESDTATISHLVHGLAEYVKEPDAVMLEGEDYKKDGFSEHPLFFCLIVDTIEETGERYPCGFAFFFFGYQLGKGRFVHLEDLFVESKYRQGGAGSLVMATLARISQALELSNFYWQALDWNTGALQFYQKIGAQILHGVKTSRYCADPNDAIKKFSVHGTK